MKTMFQKSCGILAIASVLSLGIIPAQAQKLISNFEAPTYTAGSAFVGVDGWTASPVPGNKVTPDGGGSGYTYVIDGAQSVYMGTGFARKSFSHSSVNATASDIFELTWMQASPDSLANTVEHGMFLVQNVPDGGTPLGIYGRNDSGSGTTTLSTIRLLGSNGVLDTTVPYISGGGGAPTLNKIYRFTIQFDFVNFQFEGFYEDVTLGGPKTSLGFRQFSSVLLPDAQAVADGYGFGMWSSGGTVGFDDIRLVPEPGTASLVLLGLAGFLLRRRQRR